MLLDIQLRKTIGDFHLDVSGSISAPRTGIFGPSGSGKSTLMNLLAGLTTADSGYIHLDDQLFFDSEQNINIKPEQRRIGVVFQHAHLFPHMDVRHNVLYGFKRTSPENRRIVPDDLFEILGIGSLLQRNVDTLSGGERQRVALARTVLTCPRLILMDEPLSGLDESHKFQIIPYLNRVLSEFEIPLLFISHSILEMRMMTDEVLVIDKGRVKQQTGTESLAKTSWDGGLRGYVNLLSLAPPDRRNDLFAYKWGGTTLILTENGRNPENLFELDAREILLFKRHPEATSARNLLKCRVSQIYTSGNRVRVGLECGGKPLIAQIVPESVRELGIRKGCSVVAAVKASAFKPLF